MNLIVDRQWDRSFGFGFRVYFHGHQMGEDRWPVHFHLCLDVAWWFVELQIGRDVPKEAKHDTD